MTLNIHQKIILAFVTVIFVISLYDVLFHFLLVILHILFETAEWFLDHIVEHLFETGSRETEIIVFYVLVSGIFYMAYRFYYFFLRRYHAQKLNLEEKKAETQAQWQALSIAGKMFWWSFSISIMGCWVFLT